MDWPPPFPFPRFLITSCPGGTGEGVGEGVGVGVAVGVGVGVWTGVGVGVGAGVVELNREYKSRLGEPAPISVRTFAVAVATIA